MYLFQLVITENTVYSFIFIQNNEHDSTINGFLLELLYYKATV